MLEGINVHPVFHKSLLEKAPPNAKPGLVLINLETQEPLYDVDGIIDYNLKNKKYLVKWLGYDESENTWEPRDNLPRHLI